MSALGKVETTNATLEFLGLSKTHEKRYDEMYKDGTKIGHLNYFAKPKLSFDGIQEHVCMYYSKQHKDIRAGVFKPRKFHKFSSSVEHFTAHLTERLPYNIQAFMTQPGDKSKMAVIPHCYAIPHPTLAEKDAYMARYNPDGDLNKKLMEQLKDLDDTHEYLINPFVIHEAHPKSVVMIALVVIQVPK